MSAPQTTSTMTLHAPAPRRPIALVRKQHQHQHQHSHPYISLNPSQKSTTSRVHSNSAGLDGVSRNSSRNRRSISPPLTRSRRGSAQAVSRNDSVVRTDIVDENEKITPSGTGNGDEMMAVQVTTTTSTTSTTIPNSIASEFYDTDRTPTRKEMASISSAVLDQIGNNSKNLTPTANHNRIDVQIQKASPIQMISEKEDVGSSSQSQSSSSYYELNSTRSLMESPSSCHSDAFSFTSSTASNQQYQHSHSNSNSSNFSSSQSSTHLSPFLTSTASTFSTSPHQTHFQQSSKSGLPIIPPSPISRNQTRNPFARHFSKKFEADEAMHHPTNSEEGSGIPGFALGSPKEKGKRALFLEQQEEEEQSYEPTVPGNAQGILNQDGTTRIFNNSLDGKRDSCQKKLGGNRHKISKSEEIKDGLMGLELGLERYGDEIMTDGS